MQIAVLSSHTVKLQDNKRDIYKEFSKSTGGSSHKKQLLWAPDCLCPSQLLYRKKYHDTIYLSLNHILIQISIYLYVFNGYVFPKHIQTPFHFGNDEHKHRRGDTSDLPSNREASERASPYSSAYTRCLPSTDGMMGGSHHQVLETGVSSAVPRIFLFEYVASSLDFPQHSPFR